MNTFLNIANLKKVIIFVLSTGLMWLLSLLCIHKKKRCKHKKYLVVTIIMTNNTTIDDCLFRENYCRGGSGPSIRIVQDYSCKTKKGDYLGFNDVLTKIPDDLLPVFFTKLNAILNTNQRSALQVFAQSKPQKIPDTLLQ